VTDQMNTQNSKDYEVLTDLLFELMKNARRSDRALANAIGISQPTVTRKRAQLEKEGLVEAYTVIPNLGKMGYDILVFTLFAFNQPKTAERSARSKAWVDHEPCVLFWADGEGAGMNSVMISVHKNYGSYSKLMSDFREIFQTNLRDIQNFMVSMKRKELVMRSFSLQSLERDR